MFAHNHHQGLAKMFDGSVYLYYSPLSAFGQEQLWPVLLLYCMLQVPQEEEAFTLFAFENSPIKILLSNFLRYLSLLIKHYI